MVKSARLIADAHERIAELKEMRSKLLEIETWNSQETDAYFSIKYQLEYLENEFLQT